MPARRQAPPDEDDLVWDEAKLVASTQAERGELFLLTWLSAAERAVQGLPQVRPSALSHPRALRGRHDETTRPDGR